MERDLWTIVTGALKGLPPTRPRNAVYADSQIAAVYLWAVLHDRPVSWACQRRHWPMQAWRRALPDQSTMSRRLRHPAINDLLHRIRLWVTAKLASNAARIAFNRAVAA